MQKYSGNANGDVRDIFNFLWDQGVYMFFWKERQNFCIIPAGVTCSKSTIEVLERGMKYVQSQEERPQNTITDIVLGVLIVNLKHVLHFALLFWLLTSSM